MSFFDDIEGDIISESLLYGNTSDRIYIDDKAKEYIDKEILPKYDEFDCRPSTDFKELAKQFFDCFSSADYHMGLLSLYGKQMLDNSMDIVGQSKLRYNELIKLLTEKLDLFSEKAIYNNVENFAIDTPHYVIYFHIDGPQFSQEKRQFNKYYCNDSNKAIMPFYDSNNNMEKIPYEKWDDILFRKQILMFGWQHYDGFGQLNNFLGVYGFDNTVKNSTDEIGNKILWLINYRFCFEHLIAK